MLQLCLTASRKTSIEMLSRDDAIIYKKRCILQYYVLQYCMLYISMTKKIKLKKNNHVVSEKENTLEVL